MTPSTGLLLLADSRLPAGGHVHSGGVEALVDRGLLRDADDLALFLEARVRTAGLCAAAFAAAAAMLAAEPDPERAPGHVPASDRARPAPDPARSASSGPVPAASGVGWVRWDTALDARTPSPALREASRVQGAALLRTASGAWPAAAALTALGPRPHHPLVLGVATAAAGATPGQAAALAVHHLVGGAATAAVRLLGLDPLRVAAVQAALAGTADRTAARAADAAALAVTADEPDLLPSDATPLPEVLAELHHASEVTLFAS